MMKKYFLKYLRASKQGYRVYQSMLRNESYLNWLYSESLRLPKFKNIHAGKDCFIIGNGPSIAKMDLTPLNNYYTFGLNKIHLLFEQQKLELSYHVAVNPFVMEQIDEVLEQDIFKCPSFISWNNTTKNSFKNDNIHQLFTDANWSFYPNIEKSICEGYTVTYVALQIAYYMGFKRVFFVGVDHSFKQEGKSNEVQTLKEDDQNHFHPDYFKGMKWHLADVEGNEISYQIAKRYFETSKREIIDCTVNGKLTVFPKLDFSEALKIANCKSQ